MPDGITDVLKSAAAIAKGMSVTLKEMLSPTITENYPDEPPKFEERYRGRARVCSATRTAWRSASPASCARPPARSNCIYIEAAENTETVRISGAERYAKVYNIDYNRCIFCGYCVEACPTDAITHGHGFELASFEHVHADLPQRAIAGSQAPVGPPRDHQLLVGRQRDHADNRIVRRDDPVARSRLVADGVEFDAQELEARAAGRAQARGVLADAAGEGDRVQPAHGGRDRRRWSCGPGR